MGQKWRYTTWMTHNDENSPPECRAKWGKISQRGEAAGATDTYDPRSAHGSTAWKSARHVLAVHAGLRDQRQQADRTRRAQRLTARASTARTPAGAQIKGLMSRRRGAPLGRLPGPRTRRSRWLSRLGRRAAGRGRLEDCREAQAVEQCSGRPPCCVSRARLRRLWLTRNGSV